MLGANRCVTASWAYLCLAVVDWVEIAARDTAHAVCNTVKLYGVYHR